MAEAQGISGRTAKFAVGLAVAALATALLAVIVVASRGTPTVVASESAAPVERPEPARHTVQATDVVEIDRDTTEVVTDPSGAIGVKVTDPELRQALALEPTDVITAISGRSIKRQFDIHDVVLGAGMMNTSALFVELLRDGEPVLVRWQLEGGLREARTASRRKPKSANVYGGLLGGSIGGQIGSDPFSSRRPVAPVSDPLFDTIKKIDDLTYQVPRKTMERIASDPALFSRGARIVPAFRAGGIDGLKLYAIRPTSVFAAMGLRNGDNVHTVNGVVLDDVDKVVEIYATVKGASEWKLELTRRGQPVTLRIVITR